MEFKWCRELVMQNRLRFSPQHSRFPPNEERSRKKARPKWNGAVTVLKRKEKTNEEMKSAETYSVEMSGLWKSDNANYHFHSVRSENVCFWLGRWCRHKRTEHYVFNHLQCNKCVKLFEWPWTLRLFCIFRRKFNRVHTHWPCNDDNCKCALIMPRENSAAHEKKHCTLYHIKAI